MATERAAACSASKTSLGHGKGTGLSAESIMPAWARVAHLPGQRKHAVKVGHRDFLARREVGERAHHYAAAPAEVVRG